MKKFFEKHDLFKLAIIVLLIAVIFSWVMPYTYFDTSTGAFNTSTGITRVGLFDLSTYGLLGFYYFTTLFVLIFVIGGFYKFLGKVPAYQALTDKIAKLFNGKELVFSVVSIVLYAILASVTSNYIAILVLLPFSMTLLSKLKVDKMVGIASTVGGVLIGILCTTYSTQIAGFLVSTLSVNYANEILATIILAIVSVGLLSFFVFHRILNPDKDNLLEDLFAPKKMVTSKKESGFVGIAIILTILFVMVIMACIAWEDVFKVTVFTEFMNNIKDAEVFGFKLLGSLLGEAAYEFGKWDGFTTVGVLAITTLITQLVYRVPADTVIESYSEGFKKINKTVLVLLLVYAILVVSIVYPTVPYIIQGISNLGSNVYTWFLSSVLASIFGVDMQYVSTIAGGYLASVGNSSVAALALQTGYGFVQFISPTSVMLVVGLTLMNARFIDYVKFIWKFLLALLVVILIVISVIAFV